MVSFWICIRVALFDFFSPKFVLLEDATIDEADVEVGVAAAAVDCVADAGDGSAVIKSINVFPLESAIVMC
jgi:hypothetical protein